MYVCDGEGNPGSREGGARVKPVYCWESEVIYIRNVKGYSKENYLMVKDLIIREYCYHCWHRKNNRCS